MGAGDQDPHDATARCRRGTSTGRIGIQKFKDDPSLTDDEIATIGDWVDAGAPRGNPADMPAPRQFAEHAALADRRTGLDHQVPEVQGPRGRARPLRRSVRRHPDHGGSLHQGDPDPLGDTGSRTRSCTTRSPTPCRPGLKTATARRGWRPFLVEYASGKNAEVYPEGSGVLLKAGRRPRQLPPALDRRGNRRRDSSSASSSIPKGYVPQYIRWSRQLAQPTTPIDIPAGHGRAHDGYTVLHKPARLISFQPHMHILGKRQCLELIYPTVGHAHDTELINCANFNYNWHLTYNYTDDAQPLSRPERSCTSSLARQLDRRTRVDRSEELGRRRPADDRRDGLLLDRLVRADRRRIQGRSSRSGKAEAAPRHN